jgi:hypothetical protein
MKIILDSKITFPEYGFSKIERMSTDNCQILYTCENCNENLKPNNGVCCVYCTHVTTPYSPILENKKCCK